MKQSHSALAKEIKKFLVDSYPRIAVRVETYSEDPSRVAVFFVEEKFAVLYPMQRYHYLSHLIPQDFQKKHLANSYWFELAPGETPDDLVYPDEELIGDIAPDVMKCLYASGFFPALDNALCPENAKVPRVHCYGDYRTSKEILPTIGFTEDEFFDIFHVLMAQGGFCDCEILYNVAEQSRLKGEYWRARAQGIEPYDPHKGA